MGNAISGRDGQVYLGNNVTGELKEWSLNEEMDIAKSTSKGSDYAYKFPGIKDAKVSCKFLFDPADTLGQEALRDAYINRTKLTNLKLWLAPTVGYYGPDLISDPAAGFYIKSHKINSPESGAVTYDVELEGTGTLGFTPAPTS